MKLNTIRVTIVSILALLTLAACASNSPQDGLAPITTDAVILVPTGCGAGKVSYCERRFGPHKRCGCVDKSVLDSTINIPVVQGMN